MQKLRRPQIRKTGGHMISGTKLSLLFEANGRYEQTFCSFKCIFAKEWYHLILLAAGGYQLSLEILHPAEAFNQRRYELMKAENDLLDRILWFERVKARRAMQLGL